MHTDGNATGTLDETLLGSLYISFPWLLRACIIPTFCFFSFFFFYLLFSLGFSLGMLGGMVEKHGIIFNPTCFTRV